MKRAFILIAALALLAGCAPAAPSATEAATVTEAPVVTEAPAATEPQTGADEAGTLRFSTTDREGRVWDESVFAQHSLTMINFWEPWCGPCVQEMPALQKLQDKYADRGFQILGVYATEGVEKDVDMVLDYTGADYPMLHYCESFDPFQSGYVPTTIFVDAQGRVLHRSLSDAERQTLQSFIAAQGEEAAGALYVGSMSYEEWEAVVERLL